MPDNPQMAAQDAPQVPETRENLPPPPGEGRGGGLMEKLVSLAKRRGFFYQSSEIYGGIQGVYDFGRVGVDVRNNIIGAWGRSIVELGDDIVGMDAGILLNPNVWV